MTASSEKFERITAIPAYQLVADAIEREIISRRIRPGEPIGTEAELAKQFQLNRATVREGIRLLEQGGLVRRDSSRRLFAGLPHYNRLATRISRALVLHEVTFRELFDAAVAFETAIIEQAVIHATAQDIAALEDNIAQTERVADNPAAIATLDTDFHDLLRKSAKNRVLLLAGEPLALLIFPTTELILEKNLVQGGQRLLEAHRNYVDALRRRDVAAAREWVERHLRDWRKGFERAGKELDQPVDYVYDKHRSQSGREL
jgi:GntR family transcriptional repressor for pyruvate dehydrogenase complex